MLKAVFFDLDGTLLPMDEEEFTKAYFHYLSDIEEAKKYSKKKLIEAVYNGTKKMYQNDGKISNKELFWQSFQDELGEGVLKDKPYFDDFYKNDFKKLKKVCGENPLAEKIVKFARKHLQFVVLSTNPLFPKEGTLTRMSFVGLKEEDFDYITTYENSCFCKPNKEYFISLLNKFSLKPEEVIVFGNNVIEDYICAKKAGIRCYLTGNVMNSEKISEELPIIKMEEIIEIIKLELTREHSNVE